jgi:predicted RNA-binding protein with PUA-like domain
LLKDKWTYWDGVRSYAARIHLKAMKLNDKVLFYHSNEGLEVVGCTRVIKEYYQDPTTDDERWVAVDIEPTFSFKKPVSLKQIKADKKLKDIALVKQSRLSVMPLTKEEFEHIVMLADKS